MKMKDPDLPPAGCQCHPTPDTAGTLARRKSPPPPLPSRGEGRLWGQAQLRGTGRVPACGAGRAGTVLAWQRLSRLAWGGFLGGSPMG